MKAFFTALALAASPLVAGAVDFKTDILPIFESRCFRCHGNGESRGSLSLDPDDIKRHIRASGQIRPGQGDRSILVERLVTSRDNDRMPRNGAPLAEAQIELIRQWINSGAKLEEGEGDDAKPAAAMTRPEPVKGSWTNREGKTIEATLVRVEGDNAVLVLANGQSVPYPIANLSDESQAKVKEFQEASAAGR